MQALLLPVPPALQKATANPCLHRRLLDTHGQVWVSLLWGHCSFHLGPGAHKVLFVLSKKLFPQSCVNSHSSMVVLMATSSKRAYAIPRSISSFVVPFSSHLQSFPASGSFQMSQFFASGGKKYWSGVPLPDSL